MKKTPSATATDGDGAGSLTLMPLNGDQKEYSLYFHIPFCTKKCDYCHFYVIPDQQRFHNIYKQTLKKEWNLRCALLPKKSPVSIYFGGGTPALLGPSAIAEILSWISPAETCEITLEANPENVTFSLMSDFIKSGINRVSLGIQTFDAALLKILSRTHSIERSVRAVEETFQAGIQNISIDLMYDLPGQSFESWLQTVERAISLPIRHLSLYNLTIEPHTVFFKKKKSLILPDQETSVRMLQTAISNFEEKGLKRYEISAFAKEDSHSKHNSGYWNGRPFLGFGPSACSYWNTKRFRNIAHLNKWATYLENGKDPVDFQEELPFIENLKEGLAIGLRMIQGVPIQMWPHSIQQGLLRLEEEGFLEKKENHLCLTTKGLLFHDTVAEEIMAL